MSDPFFAEDDEFGLIGACIAGGSDICFDAFAEVPTAAIQNEQLAFTYETRKSLITQN